MGDFIDVKVRGDTFIDGSGWYYAMDTSGYMSVLHKYAGTVPSCNFHFLPSWPGISSGAPSVVYFGFDSPFSAYGFCSNYNGVNEVIIDVNVATRRTGFYSAKVTGNVTGSGNKGLLWYNMTDLKWATYMAPAGSGYAIDGATANSGVFGGMTANSIRNRVQGGYNNCGWIWENSDNVAVMDLAGSAGNLNLMGTIAASGSVQSYNQFLFLDGSITTYDSGMGQYAATDSSGNYCQLVNIGTNYSSIGTVDSTLVGAVFRIDGRWNQHPFQWNIRLPGGSNAVVASMTSGGQIHTNTGYAIAGLRVVIDANSDAYFGAYCTLNGRVASTYEGFYGHNAGVSGAGWSSGSIVNRMGWRITDTNYYYTLDRLNDAGSAITNTPIKVAMNAPTNSLWLNPSGIVQMVSGWGLATTCYFGIHPSGAVGWALAGWTDRNWGIYKALSGATTSFSGAVACSYGGVINAIRFRCATSTGEGFIWEDRMEGGIMALVGSTGLLTNRGGYAVGVNTVIDSTRNVLGVSGYFTAMSAGSGVLGNDLWLATGKNIKVNGANPFRTIVLTAGGGRPTATSGCSAYSANVAAANFVEYGSLDFGAGADSYAQWQLVMPDNYDGGTIYAKFYWTAVSGTATQTVWWFVQGRAYGDNEAISGAFGTAVSGVDAYQTSGAVHISAETAAMTLEGTPLGGEYAILRVYRDVDDTLAANAKLLAVKLRYGVSAYSD